MDYWASFKVKMWKIEKSMILIRFRINYKLDSMLRGR